MAGTRWRRHSTEDRFRSMANCRAAVHREVGGVAVRVLAHYRQLAAGGTRGYQERLERRAAAAFAREPWYDRVYRTAVAAGSIAGAPRPPGETLDALAASDMDKVARTELRRLAAVAPPPADVVECHLFPCLHADRRGGFCFAPGKMLILMPLMDRWQLRLVRNITHEYSHTLRMARWPADERHGFGPTFPYSVRDFLVFEGLAECLVQQFHADPGLPPPQVTAEDEARFLAVLDRHLHLVGWEAYMAFLRPDDSIPPYTGYAVGYRLVQRYLDWSGRTAITAHSLPYADIYQGSGCTGAR